jgi:hypothetical protein
MNTVADRYKGQDEVMSAAEVAKKNKIGETADHMVDHTEQTIEHDRNGIETEKFIVDATMEYEEVTNGNDVVKGKNLKYMTKATVRFVSKGRGVSENKKNRARVKGTSDSTDTGPFLTIGTAAGTACLSCVSTTNEPASHWHEREPSALLVPMDGEW